MTLNHLDRFGCLIAVLLGVVTACANGEDPPIHHDLSRLGLSPTELEAVEQLRAMDFGFTVEMGNLGVHASGKEPIDDRAAAYIRRLPKLGSLFVGEQCLSDALATTLREVPVRWLVVKNIGLTDRGIEVLKSLPALEGLTIFDGVTDEDLRRISLLENLTQLTVQTSDVTDDGLAHLGKMKKLTVVVLFKCPKITDKGIEHLSGLTNVDNLLLDNNDGLTSRALVHLRPLTKLIRLEIDGIQVIDNDHFACLAEFKSLEHLSVCSSRLTDEGLTYLTGLTKLKLLIVERTAVTPEGARKLKAALPDVNIRGVGRAIMPAVVNPGR